MKDQFRCNGCGAPRSYVHQYCPNCESTGPHIPVEKKVTRIPGFKTSTRTEKPWWDEVEPERKAPVKKHKEKLEEKAERKPPRERKPDTAAYDEKDMRNLWDTGAPPARKIKISSRTWQAIAVAAAGVAAVVILAVNVAPIINWMGSLFEQHSVPAVTVSSPDAVNKKPDNTDTPPQSNPKPPDSTITENTSSTSKEPVKDTTPPRLAGAPSAHASDTGVTITWKTDEKSTSLVRYGTDISYPFPSTEVTEMDINHNIYISGLTPDTTYHYQVISADGSGNILHSGGYSFRTDPVSDQGPYMGSKAPDFTLKTLDGKDISLSQFRGKKVILNFWASWCTPCKVELPHLQATWEKYRDSGDVILVTVAGSQSEEALIRSHIQSSGYTFIVLLDPSDSAFNRYQIVSIPRTFFIDKGGTIRRIQQGMFTSPGEVEFMLTSY